MASPDGSSAGATSRSPHPRVLALKAFVTSHPLLAFLALTYALSWIYFLAPLLGQGGFGVLPIDLQVQPFILLTSTGGLALAAFVVTSLTRGRAGVRDLRDRYVQWRVGAEWYLLSPGVERRIADHGSVFLECGYQIKRPQA